MSDLALAVERLASAVGGRVAPGLDDAAAVLVNVGDLRAALRALRDEPTPLPAVWPTWWDALRAWRRRRYLARVREAAARARR